MTFDAHRAGDDGTPVPAAIAATEEPVQLKVGLIEDDRVPPEMVCMGTYRNGRLVARAVMSPEAWAQIEEHGFFDEPFRWCWSRGSPRPGSSASSLRWCRFRTTSRRTRRSPGRPACRARPTRRRWTRRRKEEDDPRVAPVPLGNIVRYDRDRVHPDSLPLETADVLKKIIEGDASEVVDRALSDLLGLEDEVRK